MPLSNTHTVTMSHLSCASLGHSYSYCVPAYRKMERPQPAARGKGRERSGGNQRDKKAMTCRKRDTSTRHFPAIQHTQQPWGHSSSVAPTHTSLSLSLSLTHTHTHTHSLSRTHAISPHPPSSHTHTTSHTPSLAFRHSSSSEETKKIR